MTHRIEPFFNMIERILNFSKKMTHWIEPFLQKKKWLKETLKKKLKKKKKCLNELNFFVTRLTELNFFSDTTQRIEPPFRNMTQRTQPFFLRWLQELIFLEYNSQNWTLFYKRLFRIHDSQKLNPFFGRMTQRIEPFCFFFQQWLKELNSL